MGAGRNERAYTESVTVTANLPEELAERLDALTKSDRTPVEAVVERAIRDYLDRRRDLDQATLEGLHAIRSGQTVPHEEVGGDLDGWGG